MPSYIQRHKTRHFTPIGNAWFLLVEALPQSPQDTILYPENAAKMQRLRDSSNLISGHLEIRIHGFFLRQKLGIFRLQALDGGQLF